MHPHPCIRCTPTRSGVLLSNTLSYGTLPFGILPYVKERSILEASNRHVVDRLADVRSRLKELEHEEASLRSYLLRHPDDLVGNEHEAVVYQQSRKRLDLEGLKREVDAEILHRHTTARRVVFVRVRPRNDG
jgi:hypothetical protein